MTPDWFRWCLTFLLLFLAGPLAVGAEVDEALLRLARDGNNAALGAISSLSLRFERDWVQTPPPEDAQSYFSISSGQYWYTPETFRLQERDNNHERDSIVRGGKGLTWGRRPNLMGPTLGRNAVDRAAGQAIWEYLVFRHQGREYPRARPFDELLSQPHTLNVVRLVPAGRGVKPGEILVDSSHEWCRLELRFDPTVNYLVRHRVVTPVQAKHVRWEDEVLIFTEPTPGVFIPTTIEHRCSVNGEIRAIVRTTLTDVRVNIPLGADTFRIPNIAGIECVDFIRRVKYTVDADGKQSGPDTPASIHAPIVTLTDSKIPDGPRVPSRPPTPWWWYVLGGSVVLLIAAWVIARRRGRHDESPVRMPQVTR